MSFFLSMLIALCLDWLIGWPDQLYRKFSHPVVGIGALISTADQILNRDNWPAAVRKIAGVFFLLVIMTGLYLGCRLIVSGIPSGWAGIGLTAVLAWPFIAAKSLSDHVQAVAVHLQAGDLPAAREAVSMIVGRNSEQLDQNAIARAAVESLAENTSDGVTAPLFWGVLFGLPGLVVYKAINTADSMIGYRTKKYRAFGWAAARLDDLVNLIPARLTGLMYVLLARAPLHALTVMVKDAPRHRSPNAGWPESAVASALGIRLSGPRFYNGVASSDPWLNKAGRDPGPKDITAALKLYRRLLWVVSLLLLSGTVCFFLAEKG
ncbi:MAG: adenosylcobinamide-phosphate synthase CbiB, partial [Alphaproteobacteria bacterium]|nr:adenosylcobinamide-phosphate synthase CbiB [Alphaproteobacteria bacterium]